MQPGRPTPTGPEATMPGQLGPTTPGPGQPTPTGPGEATPGQPGQTPAQPGQPTPAAPDTDVPMTTGARTQPDPATTTTSQDRESKRARIAVTNETTLTYGSDERPGTSTIASMEDAASLYMSDLRRRDLRLEEIAKLEAFGCFEPVHEVQATSLLWCRWVDTSEKSRLTVADKRTYGNLDVNMLIHCPTPTSAATQILLGLASLYDYSVKTFDVVSAFPHAEETDQIYVVPPREWTKQDPENRTGMVWKMKKSLYGRRNAAATFRDYFCSVLEKIGYQCGVHEPCAYYHPEWQCRLVHHVDDGTIVGPLDKVDLTVSYMAEHLLMKVSDDVKIGGAFEQLGRTKVRLDRDTWLTIPDPRHAENIINLVLTTAQNTKPVTSPGAKQTTRTDDDEQLLTEAETTTYRSAVGSMIFLAGDREDLMYSVKQLAKRLQQPRRCDWVLLKRAAKYLKYSKDWVIVQSIDREANDDVVKAYVDSDWAGDSDDARSASGIRVEWRGYRLLASSVTQHGVPALSSAEAELRAMSRGYCDGKFIQLLLGELGVDAKLEMYGDSSAALANAAKLGPGKLRHVVTSALLVKTAVRNKDVVLRKIGTEDNTADLHTKYHGPARHGTLCEMVGLRGGYAQEIDETKVAKLIKLNVLKDISTTRTPTRPAERMDGGVRLEPNVTTICDVTDDRKRQRCETPDEHHDASPTARRPERRPDATSRRSMIAGGVGRSAANVFNFFVMMMTNRSIGAGAQVVKYDNVIETEKGSNNLLWFICSGLVCMGILIGFVLGVLFDQYFLRYARLDPDRRQERRPDDDQDLRQERPERGPDDDQDLRQERPERGPDDDQDRHQKRPERGPDDYDTRSTYGSDRHDTTPEDHPGPTTTTPRTSIPVAATTIPPIPMIST